VRRLLLAVREVGEGATDGEAERFEAGHDLVPHDALDSTGPRCPIRAIAGSTVDYS
jgi:hypothetical protein